MKVLFGKLRIQNTPINVIGCIAMDFCASLLLLSEWYYKEHRVSAAGFKLLALAIVLIYVIFYANLIVNLFDEKRNRRRDITEKVILIGFFVFQVFVSLGLYLTLLLATVGLEY